MNSTNVTAGMLGIAAGYVTLKEVQDGIFEVEGILPKLIPVGLNSCSGALLGFFNPVVGAAAGFVFGAAYSVTHLTSRYLFPDGSLGGSSLTLILGVAKYAIDCIASTFIAWGVLEICGLSIPFDCAIGLGLYTFPVTAIALIAGCLLFVPNSE